MTEKREGAGAWRTRLLAPAVVLSLVTAGLSVVPSAASGAPGLDVMSTTSAVVRPDGPLAPSSITAEQMAELNERHLELRERVALAQPYPLGDAATADAIVPAQVEPTGVTGDNATQSLLIRRNNRNTRASVVSLLTPAEPTAANDGNAVFYSGNTYASSSTNNGVTWANVGLPAGPADAPLPLGDPDVIRAHSRDRLFNSLLYTNSGRTHGVVRIFVRSAPTAAPLCSYTINPGAAVFPDYPHLGLSANALYLSTSNHRGGTDWVSTQMHRLDLAQMSACQPATRQIATYTPGSQRIFIPTEGMQNTTQMVWAAIETTFSLRIFRWAEGSSSISMNVRLVNAFGTAEADCRGGTGNHDFMDVLSTHVSGFSLQGTRHGSRVTWFWNSARTSGRPQAHVRGASFRFSDLALLEQPVIWNPDFCFAYPAVNGNVFGDLGISIAAGGRAGGGGTAAQGHVGVDDTPGNGIQFGSVVRTASGTHNHATDRYGDYFTVRTNARCQFAYVATNYSLLNGNTSSAHVNARYVEFGSTLDSACF